jgi:hypothetical protein
MLPPDDRLAICFAHVAYRLHERFSALATGISSFAVRDGESLMDRIGEADVLVISGLWRNILNPALAERGIRLASARGVNARAVAEHAMALILALSRRLPEAPDNQKRRRWRQMIGDPDRRDEPPEGSGLQAAKDFLTDVEDQPKGR